MERFKDSILAPHQSHMEYIFALPEDRQSPKMRVRRMTCQPVPHANGVPPWNAAFMRQPPERTSEG